MATLGISVAGWAERQDGRWSLWLPLLLTAGAVAELAAPVEPPVWLGAALVVPLTALLWRLRRRRWGQMPPACLLAVATGVLAAQVATWRAPPPLPVPRRAVVVTGTVSGVDLLPNGLRVTVAHPLLRPSGADADGPAEARSVRIRLRPAGAGGFEPAAGDVVRVRALLSAPSPPAYPGAWDLRRDAFFRGLGAYGFALGAAERVDRAPAAGPARWLPWLREAIVARLNAALPPDRAAIAATLLTGSASAMSEADRSAFRDSGLAHLLAIAGLHMGIVMGLAFGTVRLSLAAVPYLALRLPTKAAAAVASVAVGGFYMLLTGAHVPIMRSFAMACLVTLAVLTGRVALSLRGLALAMAAIVLIAPDQALGVSFQMSFSAVLALIAGYEALRPWLRRLHGDGSAGRRLAGHVVALALTSALAGTASAPYGQYHFGHVQLYFVLANMAAVPLTAFWVMPLGLVSLLLMPFGWEALTLRPMGWGEAAILWIGRTVSALPASVLPVPAPSPSGLILFSLGLAWLGLWRGPVRLFGVPAMALGLATAFLVRPPDVLVSADARLIGVRLPSGVYVQSGRAGEAAFTRDAWQAAWVVPAVARLPATGAAADGAILCDRAACRIRLRDSAVLIARKEPGEAACESALILSPGPLRQRCPGGAAIIDRFSVWRDGAQAAWLDGSRVRIETASGVSGVRPWAPPPQIAAGAPGLHLATEE